MASTDVQLIDRVDSKPKAVRVNFFPGKVTLALILLVLLVTAGVYMQVHHHPYFSLDDQGYFPKNDGVNTGLHWSTFEWALTSYYASNWHPVTWISHALDAQFFGLGPTAPHDENVLLHLINVVLIFWVLWKATGYAGRSLMVAALFALHPINVESVAWVAERKTMLSMLFFLLALGAYRWYASKPRVGPYIVVALLFVLGLMSKPQVITFPCVLLLWDYWPLRRLRFGAEQSRSSAESDIPTRSLFALIKEKIPLFVICLVDSYLTMRAQKVGRPKYWPYTFHVRVENAIVAYAKYVWNAVWPTRLAPMYLHPGNSIRLWQVSLAMVFLLAVTAFVVFYWRRGYLAVGWLWFLGTMVPMVGLMQVGRQAMADRYAYLPFVGLFIMFCWGLADLARARRLPAALLPTASVIVLAILAVLTYRQVGYWANDLTIWNHTAQVTEGNWFAESCVGDTLRNSGRKEEAVPHYLKVLKSDPSNVDANLGVALYLHESGRYRESIDYYNEFLAKAGDDERLHQVLINLGYIYRRLGDNERSKEYFDKAEKVPATNMRNMFDH